MQLKYNGARRNGIQSNWRNSSLVASSPFVSPGAALWSQWVTPRHNGLVANLFPWPPPPPRAVLIQSCVPEKSLLSCSESKPELESNQRAQFYSSGEQQMDTNHPSLRCSSNSCHNSCGLQADVCHGKHTQERRQFPSQGSSLFPAPVFTLFDFPLHKQPRSHQFLPSDTTFLKAAPHKKFTSHYISCSSVPLSPPPTTPYVPYLFPTEQFLVSEIWQLKWPPPPGPQLCLSRSQRLQLEHSALLRNLINTWK